jgi:hypothetical protein
MSTTIVMTEGNLGDAESMARFLADIPNADRLAAVLRENPVVSSRAYDDERETARFVASDGVIVKCFTVSEITIDQAEMIAFVGVDILGLGEPEFRELVERALGPTLDAPTPVNSASN